MLSATKRHRLEPETILLTRKCFMGIVKTINNFDTHGKILIIIIRDGNGFSFFIRLQFFQRLDH